MVRYKTQILRSLSLSRCMLHAFLASAKRRRRRRPKRGSNLGQMGRYWQFLWFGLVTILPASPPLPSLVHQQRRTPKEERALPSLPSAAAADVALFPSQQHLGQPQTGEATLFLGDSPSSFFRYLATIEKNLWFWGWKRGFENATFFLKEKREEGGCGLNELLELDHVHHERVRVLQAEIEEEKFENRKWPPFPENNRSYKPNNTADVFRPIDV